MRATPFAALVAACVLVLTSCGDDDSDPDSRPDDSPASEEASAQGDSEQAEPPVEPKGICEALEPADFADALGAELSGDGGQGQASCTFMGQEDMRPLVSIAQTDLAAAGGLKLIKQGMRAMGQGQLAKVPEVGDAAFLTVLEGPAGARVVAALVDGENVIQLQVDPGDDVDADGAEDAARQILDLIDERR